MSTAQAGPTDGSTSAWAPFRHAAFRSLWLAQLGSNVGTWMQSLAAQWFLVHDAHSPVYAAWIQTASLAPTLLLSVIAGVLADTVDRRRVLLVTNALSAAAALTLTGLAIAGNLAPSSLLVATFVLGCFGALGAPAWSAIQPDLVARSEIPAAASLGGLTINGARAIGPAVAGLLLAAAGPGVVFAVNAVSFIGVLVAVWRWRPRVARAPRGREPFLASLQTGLRYVRAAPSVRRIMLRSVLFALPSSALLALLPAVAQGRLGLSAAGYGALLGVMGVGAVSCVGILPALRRRVSTPALLAGGALLYAAASAAPALLPLPALFGVLFIAGAAYIAMLSTLNGTLQLALSGWARARGMAIYLMVFIGGQALATFAWGLLAGAVGTDKALLTSAGLTASLAIVGLWLPLRPGTGNADRVTPVTDATMPALTFNPADQDGPVSVMVRYAVLPGKEEQFRDVMDRLERSRRRSGASRWQLQRSGETPTTFREQFMVPSWAEYTQLTTARWSRYDQQQLDDATALLSAPPQTEHYLPATMSVPPPTPARS